MKQNYIKLQKLCLQNVPFDLYEKDFTFIVNGEEFHTNRLIADILSPKISQIHHVDPTISTFVINSKHKGNFSKILDLINFQRNQISKEELQFLSEIIQLLDIKSIEVNFKDVNKEITLTNVFSKIKDHENNGIFFRTNLQREIDFLSSNIYQLKDENFEEFQQISEYSINQVLIKLKCIFVIKKYYFLFNFFNQIKLPVS